MHDSRVMWFYFVFGVTVIKSHLCVYFYVFFNLTGGTKGKRNRKRKVDKNLALGKEKQWKLVFFKPKVKWGQLCSLCWIR